jgi:hypothetical protein
MILYYTHYQLKLKWEKGKRYLPNQRKFQSFCFYVCCPYIGDEGSFRFQNYSEKEEGKRQEMLRFLLSQSRQITPSLHSFRILHSRDISQFGPSRQ